jgi:hypothetical protein
LLRDHDTVLRGLLTYLDVGPPIELASGIKKVTPDRLDDALSNYAELVAALRGTEFEKYLA